MKRATVKTQTWSVNLLNINCKKKSHKSHLLLSVSSSHIIVLFICQIKRHILFFSWISNQHLDPVMSDMSLGTTFMMLKLFFCCCFQSVQSGPGHAHDVWRPASGQWALGSETEGHVRASSNGTAGVAPHVSGLKSHKYNLYQLSFIQL